MTVRKEAMRNDLNEKPNTFTTSRTIFFFNLFLFLVFFALLLLVFLVLFVFLLLALAFPKVCKKGKKEKSRTSLSECSYIETLKTCEESQVDTSENYTMQLTFSFLFVSDLEKSLMRMSWNWTRMSDLFCEKVICYQQSVSGKMWNGMPYDWTVDCR